jgi:hypothetical protein
LSFTGKALAFNVSPLRNGRQEFGVDLAVKKGLRRPARRNLIRHHGNLTRQAEKVLRSASGRKQLFQDELVISSFPMNGNNELDLVLTSYGSIAKQHKHKVVVLY